MLLRAFVALLVLTNTAVFAQGFRVSTHIYDLQQKDERGRPPILSSSLSLFHNGRVYDYVDAADEVIIFDPVEKRFTILNSARELSTTLNFEEMRHLLETRVPRVEQYIEDLVRQKQPGNEKIVTSLRFQMNPEFQESFDSVSGRLTMTSPSWTYRVETREWTEREQVERYLAYADWTAKLNHLVHPGSLFPEPRIVLNESLKKLEGRIPVSVELDLRPNESLHLKAEHRFAQNLDDADHARIARWEQMLNSRQLKTLPFRNYQEIVLASRR
ncbi:MAG: hypothetical protein JNL58_28000 [Planctomyces sp.]|nr:hypothetical protein [Planctomyces sp.]